jgi:molybdate transport repressor ModE-like protein
MTLQEKIKECGSIEQAAIELKLPYLTVFRWIKRKNRISQMGWMYLEKYGITELGEK